jgi:hypothetical protein
MKKDKFIFGDRFNVILSNNRVLLKDSITGSHAIIPIKSEISCLIRKNFPFFYKEWDKTLFRKLKKFMIPITENCWIYRYIGTRFEKNALYYFNLGINFDAIQKLKETTILIIGIGGTGSEILKHLSASGLDKFVLVDFDNVQASNLNRQYSFSQNDIGKSKLDIIKNLYMKSVKIKTIKSQITSFQDINGILYKNPDIGFIVNCADTPALKIQEFLLEGAINYKKPFISGGVGLCLGNWGPLLGTQRLRIKYKKELSFVAGKVDFVGNCQSSFGPTNSAISALMAKDIIFCLLGLKQNVVSRNKQIILNFDRLEINES